MAQSKIKKKAPAGKTPILPRQGAIPCLILILLVLGVAAFFFFAAFHSPAS